MTRAQKHQQSLDRTKALLAKPHSTREAADALGTTVPTIVAHVQALKRQGVKFKETRVPLTFHGPAATRYQVLDKD